MKPDSKSFPTEWLREQTFFTGREFFGSLETSIDQAKKSICLEVYIYEDDALGKRLTDLLLKAHRRGVEVRLIVDGIGSMTWQNAVAPRLLRQGLAIRVYRPVPLLGGFTGGVQPHSPQRFTQMLQYMNHRNHRKLCVIDSELAYLGSMNISAHHVEGLTPDPAWRDTGVCVSGPGVMRLQQSFERVWGRQNLKDSSPSASAQDSESLFLNQSRLERRQRYKELLRRILESQQRVWITSAYFVPRRSLIRALKKKARSGCDVRILLPGTSDVFFMPWVQSTFYDGLLKAGARIFEYQPSVLHAKSIQVDNWTLVGSANLNHRSILHDLEVEVVLTHPSSIEKLETQFHLDQSQSREIRPEEWEKAAWLRKNLGNSLLFLRNWF